MEVIIMVDFQRREQLYNLREGDLIELTTGEKFTFIRSKRTKFVAKKEMDGKIYDVPEHMFKSLIQKAPPKQLDRSYTTLKAGELFCIKGNKSETILFKFKEIKNGKIRGEDPFNGTTWTLDVGLYIGKVSDIK